MFDPVRFAVRNLYITNLVLYVKLESNKTFCFLNFKTAPYYPSSVCTFSTKVA